MRSLRIGSLTINSGRTGHKSTLISGVTNQNRLCFYRRDIVMLGNQTDWGLWRKGPRVLLIAVQFLLWVGWVPSSESTVGEALHLQYSNTV